MTEILRPSKPKSDAGIYNDAERVCYWHIAEMARCPTRVPDAPITSDPRGNMLGKITLEDHFAIEVTVGYSQLFGPHVWGELRHRLLDFQEQRLRLMDEWGVEIMIASLNAPGVQAIPDVKRAIEVARQANDVLADEVAKRPDRFFGFAALPMQDPETATRELQRCTCDLGFKGALVNGYAEVDGKPVHYDLPQYRPFWRALEALDIPFYLHPRPPMAGVSPLYDGHPWLFGPTWSFRGGNRAARPAADWQRPVRRLPAPADHYRPSRRGAAVLSLAHRQREQLDLEEGIVQKRGEEAGVRLFPRQFSSHHVRPFQYARADRLDRRDRRRPGHVLSRLPVRGLQRRRGLVR